MLPAPLDFSTMKEGISIDNFDPKPAVQKNAENAYDWEYTDEAKYLYGMAVTFKDRFLDPILHTDRGRLPDPVISFDDLRNKKTLAAYTLHRNPQGLLDEITFNTVHFEEKDEKKVWKNGRWAQLETLLHEQVHLWDDEFFEALEILQDVQKEDIFKTGTIEDNRVYEAMLALLLSETVHRHDKSDDP